MKKEKSSKVLFGILLMLCIMLTVTLKNSIEAKAASADEAITWVQSQVGKAIDYDGAYGAQCVDLIQAYYAYLGVSPVSGNGADYATNTLPAGFARYQGAVPQKGDILVYSGNAGNPYGHVAIFESARVTYHQNYDNDQHVRKVTNVAYNGFSNPYWGVIRPSFSGAQPVNKFASIGAENITETDAKITARLSSLTYITTCGFYMSADPNYMPKAVEETVNGNVLDIFYEMQKDYKPLNPGMTYYYKFFYNTPDGYFESSVGNFTTGGTKGKNLGDSFTAIILKTDIWKPVRNNGTNIILQTETGAANEKWRFTRQPDGSYVIKSLYDGKVMDVTGASSVSGTNVGPYVQTGDDNWAQKWYIYDSGSAYKLMPKCGLNTCLDVYDNNGADGTNIQIHTDNGTVAQIFSIYQIDEVALKSVRIANGSVHMGLNETRKLSCTLEPANTTYNTVSWSSSNPSVASVDANGNVTAKALGTATITCANTFNSNIADAITVTVTETSKLPFRDVQDGDWYKDPVAYVYREQIMTGLEPQYFGAALPLSRGQFATILYRMEGTPSVSYTPVFSDVQPEQFYTLPVLWANRENIVTGYLDGSFGPGDEITREQMAVMMYRYAVYKGYNVTVLSSLERFSDGNAVSQFAETAMKWAVGNGIITGNADGTLAPQGTASRAACATIIQRFRTHTVK